MTLRIYRTWYWELAVPPPDSRFGGDTPMRLVANDILQFWELGKWKDVAVVEEPKPPHPADVRREREQNELVERIMAVKREDIEP